jgi:transposase
LTKRHGFIYSQGKTKWTKTYYAWLKSLQLDSTARCLLEIELEALKQMEDRRKALENALASFFDLHADLKEQLESYQRLRGFGPICAQILVLEGGDLSRFSHPRKLMSFTGIVPGLFVSGTSTPHCAITKRGNKYLRYAFVCASKMYVDYRCLYSSKALEQFTKPVAEFINRCQKRLNGRSQALRRAGKHVNKVRCAIARELCAFVWEYVVKVIPTVESLSKAA